MSIQRLENVGIVVDDLGVATEFFVELGLERLGEGPVEGGWVDRVDVAMLGTPDGHGGLELTPSADLSSSRHGWIRRPQDTPQGIRGGRPATQRRRGSSTGSR